MSRLPVLLVDNHDSFTFNLVDAFTCAGADVRVLRNTVAPGEVLQQAEQGRGLILLSPGPGGPEDAGCCLELIDLARGRVPLVGVCLGHQAIAHVAGASVGRAPLPMHGKTTTIAHDGLGPFRKIPKHMRVGRYHSLSVADLPGDVHVHARADGVVMAMSLHAEMQVGLQFHPESILTEHGDAIVANLIDDAASSWAARPTRSFRSASQTRSH